MHQPHLTDIFGPTLLNMHPSEETASCGHLRFTMQIFWKGLKDIYANSGSSRNKCGENELCDSRVGTIFSIIHPIGATIPMQSPPSTRPNLSLL